MTAKPTPEELSAMWWEGKDTRRGMLVHAIMPDGTDVLGHVIGRGSMLLVCEPDGTSTPDIRPEWVQWAALSLPRPPAGA